MTPLVVLHVHRNDVFQGVLKDYRLMFEFSQLKPHNFERWAIRPLEEDLLKYAATEISLFFPLKAAMEKVANSPEEDKILAWSEKYCLSRVNDNEFDYDSRYKLHGLMPMNILKPADSGSKACTGCGIKLAPHCYSKTQRRKKAQKCVVCKAIQQKIDRTRVEDYNTFSEYDSDGLLGF